jgi:hypothetical protein
MACWKNSSAFLVAVFSAPDVRHALKSRERQKRPKIVAGVAGLEPVTSAVTGQRSNQLSYTPTKGQEKVRKRFEQVNG